MYKKQLGLQKIACYLAVISSAIWFLYSMGMITDIYDALYYTMQNPNDLTETLVPGSIVYYDMQDFNKLFTNASIGLILLGCLLFLTNTHNRRKYYIGNYVSTGLYCVASLGMAIWSHIQISAFKTQFLETVDFEALKTWSEMFTSIKYTESTFLLDLHLAVAAISILSVAVMVGNLIWKISLMRGEQQLIASSAETGKEAVI
ncbi:MAG: hypothetical protein LUJ09_04300 [Firmicutes bacterium]|nr:hypothetical protein [Bacillota bacterium]